MCKAQNAANPNGFASILTKPQQKNLVSKSDSSLNALAIHNHKATLFKKLYRTANTWIWKAHLSTDSEYAPMMGLIGAGNNPMVGMTVACAVAVNEALNK